MESSQTISKFEIPINKIFYDKKSKRFTVDIMGFTFIGIYKKSTRVSEILNDIYASLIDIQIERKVIYFLDSNNLKINENLKLKDLNFQTSEEGEEKEKKELISKKKPEKKRDTIIPEEEEVIELDEDDGLIDYEKSRKKGKKQRSMFKEVDFKDEILEEKKKMKEEPELARSIAPPKRPSESAGAPGSGPPPSGPPPVLKSDKTVSESVPITPVSEAQTIPQPTRYDINMGFQYYSVMMEQQSYFFYVYFSHEELIIKDEEGKTIYKTKFTIITTKEEPPILDLRVEGEGFEVHPLSGKVEVKKEFVNPPVMIFSILPIKSKKPKKEKKLGEKRFLHVYIDFENKNVSHSVLSITVQPKHFHLDIGPFHLDISKRVAIFISFISILITAISAIYSISTIDISSTTTILSGFIPGIGSFIFFATFIYTLIKEGVFPIQQQINSLLNFDKGITTLK